MLEKFEKDSLFFHKVGLIFGTIFGLLIGFVVSDRADQFEVEEINVEEVLTDGPEKN